MKTVSSLKGFAGLFIGRPVLAVVVNLLIAIAGFAALSGVEVREMPDVDQPALSVWIGWDGAAPETIDTEVTEVIEDALSQLDGLKALSSTSSYGSSRVTIDLQDGTDIDTAANDAREIVSQAERDLPEGIDDPTVSKNDSNSEPIVQLSLLGEASMADMTRIAEGRLTDVLGTIPGVSEVQIYGEQENEFRVQVFLPRLAGLGLDLGDVQAALKTLRVGSALGDLETATQAVVLRSRDPEVTVEMIEDLRINEHIRIGDTAQVDYTAKEREVYARTGGETSVGLGVVRQSLGNTLTISQEVRTRAEALQAELPEDMELVITSDDGIYIEQSIREVTISIGLAVMIVIAVIFAFLRSWRATLIPALTIPISLTGAIAAIWIAGFSVNTITLLALVLATGMVVDDAIVVIENIVRRRQMGLGPRAAAAAGTNEVFFAVVSTTATLAAVFIPISFLPGQAGGIFAEFGFVLAFCVFLSSAVALTLAPVIAAALDPGAGGSAAPQTKPGGLGRLYLRTVNWTLAAPGLALGIAVAFAIFATGTFTSLSSTLTPAEDRGYFLIMSRAPAGASLDYTDTQAQQIEAMLAPYTESGEISSVLTLVGARGSGTAFTIVRLADWANRERSQQEIMAELNPRLAMMPGLTNLAFSPNSLGIRGAGRGLQFALLGDDYELLNEHAATLVAAMQGDPAFVNPQLAQDASQPQIDVSIDRDMATQLGLSPEAVAATINVLTEGIVAQEVFVGGEETEILLKPGGAPVRDPQDIESVFMRTSGGKFVPLSTVVTLEQTAAAASLGREERSRAVNAEASLGAGVSLGGAAARLQEIAGEILPADVRLTLRGEAASLEESQSGTVLVFGVALLVVLLVLAAQFESFASAAVIMLTVPFGLGAAVLAIWLTGGTLNYYSQIGLVILIGIMAKNGILIVEFANQLREAGQDVSSALRDAVRLRLRPVMMTAVSTVLGGLPLVLASGAGAEAREAVGWVIVGGLGFATVFTLFLTPLFYRLIAPFGGTPGAAKRRLAEEALSAAS